MSSKAESYIKMRITSSEKSACINTLLFGIKVLVIGSSFWPGIEMQTHMKTILKV